MLSKINFMTVICSSLQRPYTGGTSYNNWSPPAQSNETSNGYIDFCLYLADCLLLVVVYDSDHNLEVKRIVRLEMFSFSV